MSAGTHLPIIDIGPLLDPATEPSELASTALEIDGACRNIGFFGIVGHGVDPALQQRLEELSRQFFALPEASKATVAMARGGPAWRGWFPLGGELTSGRADRKEGIYFGLEHPADHPLVRVRSALHGSNLFPKQPANLGPTVMMWLEAMRTVADAVMRGIAVGLGLPAGWFAQHVTDDPTVLFRIFHYPPTDDLASVDSWGVAEHTDYGLLTVLAQDDVGGLEVALPDGSWVAVDPRPGMFVCNLGDMLERLTNGRYLSTPHRVCNTSNRARLSFPYFFDPSWDAVVPTLPIAGQSFVHRDRWDGADVLAWDGTYGDYLTSKVSKVFPDLFTLL